METRVIAGLFSVLVLGCQADETADPIEPADFAEVCGQTEPVRLLGFEPWREIRFAWYWRQLGDHHLIVVYYDDNDNAPRALWSVGPCGEAPRQLISGNFYFWTIAGQDWPLVRDTESGAVLVVDPSGERNPRQLFELPSDSTAQRNDAGFFYVRPDNEDGATADLVMYPWPEDIWVDEIEPEIILAGVKMDALYDDGNDLLLMTIDDELVRVSTTDGEVEVLATGVRSFSAGYELNDSELGYAARYLVWQHVEGEIMLLDRSTGQLSSLGGSTLEFASSVSTSWSASGVLELQVEGDDGPVLRLFQLPSLGYVDVPTTVDLQLVLADGRHAVARVGEDEPLGILDLQTGEFVSLTSFFPNAAHHTSYEQRVLALLPAASSNAIFADSELWLIRDGDPPELVAHRATINHEFMLDGRLLTGIGLDGNQVGDLIVVDEFEERLIDRGVLTSHLHPATNEDPDPTVLTYSIVDGDRAGLWLARLPVKD
jgi:hypothetical protein